MYVTGLYVCVPKSNHSLLSHADPFAPIGYVSSIGAKINTPGNPMSDLCICNIFLCSWSGNLETLCVMIKNLPSAA